MNPDEEAAFFEGAKSEAEREALRIIKAKSKRMRQDMKLRKEHAAKALGLAQAATGFWMFMFAAAAFTNVISGKAFLSDSALITLTAGATVNVIAVFIVVVRGLFPPLVSEKEKPH